MVRRRPLLVRARHPGAWVGELKIQEKQEDERKSWGWCAACKAAIVPRRNFSPGKRRMERYLKRMFWALTIGAGLLLLNGIVILSGVIPAGG